MRISVRRLKHQRYKNANAKKQRYETLIYRHVTKLEKFYITANFFLA